MVWAPDSTDLWAPDSGRPDLWAPDSKGRLSLGRAVELFLAAKAGVICLEIDEATQHIAPIRDKLRGLPAGDWRAGGLARPLRRAERRAPDLVPPGGGPPRP